MRPKRPASVTILLWWVLILSAWGLVRSYASLRWWDLLHEFEASLSPAYLFASGAVWFFAGALLFWRIITRNAATRLKVVTASGLWQAQLWAERILFEVKRANLAFAVTTSILILVTVAIAAFHPSTTIYFSRSEDHEQADEHSKIT